jgi:putative metallohydrolase (TIGR04338 family)
MVGKQSPQQTAVYRAEGDLGTWMTFDSIEEVQGFCDGITSRDWWEPRFPHIVKIEAYDAEVNTCSFAGSDTELSVGYINIATSMRNANVVLHEIAHCVAGTDAGHTAHWARTFMELVYRVMGSDEYAELYTAFAKHGVDVG